MEEIVEAAAVANNDDAVVRAEPFCQSAGDQGATGEERLVLVVPAMVPAVLSDFRRQDCAREAPEKLSPSNAAVGGNRHAGQVAVTLAQFHPNLHSSRFR